MKTRGSNLISMCAVVAVVLSFTGKSKSQEYLIQKNFTETFTVKNKSDAFLIPADSADKDFIVNFEDEVISLIKLLQLLRHHNVTVPINEKAFLDEVFHQKQSSAQSCARRCFLEERSESKWCYCDKDCKTWGDCCLDFHMWCGASGKVDRNASLENVTCGDINDPLWSGVIMKSTCALLKNQTTNDCQTVQRLNMTLLQELPVFDWNNSVTYRSIACARCNSGGGLSFWGLDITCSNSQQRPQQDISSLKKFVEEKDECKWKYQPFPNFRQRYKSCVIHDSQCASNQLPVMSVIRELCSSYSMVFEVQKNFYRNPHCALCSPKGRQQVEKRESIISPLSILFDMSSSILQKKEPQTAQPPTQGFNLTSQVLNCSSSLRNCTVTYGGKRCLLLTTLVNQSTKMDLKSSRVKVLTPKQILLDKDAMKPEANTVHILCPEYKKDQQHEFPAALIYITFTGTLLSIVSLCFLLAVYLSFRELRNLPGKCLISLSWAIIGYQVIFLFTEKSKEVDAVCKVVAICLHFFVLAAFSWMSIMSFDTSNTFKVQVSNRTRQACDIRKTFIKYCIVGWGFPAVAVIVCAVLDFTGTFQIGYGSSYYCWISDKTAIAVTMVTPVSLVLVFNIVCLTKNVYAIYHLQQGAGLATTNTSRVPLVLICIKLTTLMGLTWILTLMANWQHAAFLEYPSTVLNSMQGFFITLCFTTTKRMRVLFKEKLCKRCSRLEPQANIAQCTQNADPEITTGSTTLNMTRKNHRTTT